jgi:hypothetical protein
MTGEDIYRPSLFQKGGIEVICSTFGCANYLSIREQLFGNKCLACGNNKKSMEGVLNEKINSWNTNQQKK